MPPSVIWREQWRIGIIISGRSLCIQPFYLQSNSWIVSKVWWWKKNKRKQRVQCWEFIQISGELVGYEGVWEKNYIHTQRIQTGVWCWIKIQHKHFLNVDASKLNVNFPNVMINKRNINYIKYSYPFFWIEMISEKKKLFFKLLYVA